MSYLQAFLAPAALAAALFIAISFGDNLPGRIVSRSEAYGIQGAACSMYGEVLRYYCVLECDQAVLCTKETCASCGCPLDADFSYGLFGPADVEQYPCSSELCGMAKFAGKSCAGM